MLDAKNQFNRNDMTSDFNSKENQNVQKVKKLLILSWIIFWSRVEIILSLKLIDALGGDDFRLISYIYGAIM